MFLKASNFLNNIRSCALQRSEETTVMVLFLESRRFLLDRDFLVDEFFAHPVQKVLPDTIDWIYPLFGAVYKAGAEARKGILVIHHRMEPGTNVS